MKRVLRIAGREFEATVATKGFIFGLLITPLLLLLIAVVFPRLMTKAPPKVVGEIAVIDATGRVAPGVREYLLPEALAQRFEEKRARLNRATSAMGGGVVAQSPQAKDAMQRSLDAALGTVPRLDVVALDPASDVEEAKAPLLTLPAKDAEHRGRLAVAVIARDAVQPAPESAAFGSYELYVREQLDDRIEDEVHDALREAIVAARIEASGLDPSRVDAMTKIEKVTSRTVARGGERETNEIANVLLPAGFMILLLVSVLTSGQYLLTSTVEEKSNRIVEVLLSAVSPMELMTGKILGQMAVGLLVLALYLAMGIWALFSFAMMGILDPLLIVYLAIFFFLSYLTIGSLMAAIGAAVNEMREAQSLMTPVMLTAMVPWILWMPISRDPNSLLATVLSFIPPFGNFVMLLRMTSTAPPPMWQPWVSILTGVVGALASLWFAGKVFRIGLLMYGKPPTFATLVRWAKMA